MFYFITLKLYENNWSTVLVLHSRFVELQDFWCHFCCAWCKWWVAVTNIFHVPVSFVKGGSIQKSFLYKPTNFSRFTLIFRNILTYIWIFSSARSTQLLAASAAVSFLWYMSSGGSKQFVWWLYFSSKHMLKYEVKLNIHMFRHNVRVHIAPCDNYLLYKIHHVLIPFLRNLSWVLCALDSMVVPLLEIWYFLWWWRAQGSVR